MCLYKISRAENTFVKLWGICKLLLLSEYLLKAEASLVAIYTFLYICVLPQLLMRHQRKMLEHHSRKIVKCPQFQMKQTLIQAGSKKHIHSQDRMLCRYICVTVYKSCVSNKGSYHMLITNIFYKY